MCDKGHISSKDKYGLAHVTKLFKATYGRLTSKPDYLLLFFAMVIYIAILSYVSISSHYQFQTNAWDLGIFNQALSSTLKYGKFFYYTAESVGIEHGSSFFGIHFAPILLLLLPVYALSPNPTTLLIIRPTLIAIGVIPLYWIARDNLKSKKLIWLFIIGYLMYPPLVLASSNFDLIAFLPVLFLFSIYYLKKNKLLKSYAFLILALMSNEFVPFIVITIGVYFSFIHGQDIIRELGRKRLPKSLIFSLILILTSVGWFALATSVISHFNPNALNTKWEWGTFGSSPSQIILSVASSPTNVINRLFLDGGRKFLYLSTLFGPIGFLSFLDPLLLLMTLPWFAASFLSINPLYYSLGVQYPAFVVAFIFVSAIYGVSKFDNQTNGLHAKKIASFLVFTLLFSTLIFPTTLFPSPRSSPEGIIRDSINMIPPNASASVMPEYFHHISDRLYVYPYYVDGVDYVLININSWWFTATLPPPANLAPPWYKAPIGKNYGLIVNARGILLYQKDYVGDLKRFEPIDLSFNYENLQSGVAQVVENTKSDVGELGSKKVLMHNETDLLGLFWSTPEYALSPGAYEINNSLMINHSKTNGQILTLKVIEADEKAELFTQTIDALDFKESNKWQNFTFSFEVNKPRIVIVELCVSNSTTIYSDTVRTLQISGRV